MVFLTDLPRELISPLPNHLSSLDDWYALIRTSRYFYVTCASTTAHFPAVFQPRHGSSLLPPHPHMLLAGIARQIGDWAIQSHANQDILWEALDKGNVGLLDLGAQVARLSVQDIRALHRDKIEVVRPMAERIHRDIRTHGGYPISTSKFRATPEVCVFNHVIYSELFHHEIDRLLGQGGGQYIPSTIKHKWIELCMSSPEERTSSSAGQNGVQSNFSGKHSLGSPADSDDVAEDTIDHSELNLSATWNSIWRLQNTISSPDRWHSVCARFALDHRGIYSLRLRLSLSNGDIQTLPSDVEEMIYEGMQFSAGLQEAQGEPPELCDLLEYLGRHW